MRAAVRRRYGPPEVIQIADIANPVPADNEVLVRVRCAAVNPYDWHFLRGEPYLLRLMLGLRRPTEPRFGADLAGEIEAVGRNVVAFKRGDAVFGLGKGAFAEYVCVPESSLAGKPANISFEEAAGVGIAGLTALQSLRDKGHIQAGQKVLINGASGGVGTFAVQIAKSFAAEVTGVCSTKNLDLVKSLGADHVIDYTSEDFTKSSERYDIILDLIGNHSLSSFRHVLTPNGIYVSAGGTTDRWMIGPLLQMLHASVWSRFGSRKLVSILAKANQRDLNVLREFLELGKVKPVIDRVYRLTELADAIRYLEQGHARGKLVIRVS